MKVAVPKETFPGERRVALIPASIPALIKAGLEVLVQVLPVTRLVFPISDIKKKAQKSSHRGTKFLPPISSSKSGPPAQIPRQARMI